MNALQGDQHGLQTERLRRPGGPGNPGGAMAALGCTTVTRHCAWGPAMVALGPRRRWPWESRWHHGSLPDDAADAVAADGS